MTANVINAGDGLPLTIPSLIRQHSRERGEHIFLATDTDRLSYAEADRQSREIARGLLAAGAKKGTHIGLLLPNGADFIAFALAGARIGAVILPFSTLSTAEELKGLLSRSDTAFLIAARQIRNRDIGQILNEAFPDMDFSSPHPVSTGNATWLQRVWFTGNIPETWHENWSAEGIKQLAQRVDMTKLDAIEGRVLPSDRFVIIHTSGSTSIPKGVIHTHGAFIRHLDNINQIRRFNADDVLFSSAPWFWVAGFGFGLLGTLVAGARIVCSNSQQANVVLDLIERERPTTTNGYAPSVAWLAEDPGFKDRDLSWLRRGNLWPIMAPDVRPPDPTLRHDIYGASETGSAVSLSGEETDLPNEKRGSCGKFLPGFDAKIVNTETGEVCPNGEIGELWVRGPFMMEGYYGKSRSEVFDRDGWWPTSDAGMIDEEGLFYLKGRLGSMIKTAGANVAPREVEAAMSEITGGRLCVVIGVPDPERGQAVAGIVVAENQGDVDIDALKNQLAKKLSKYKVPRQIFVYSQDEMPTLSSGKLDLNSLKRIVKERWESS